MITARRFQAEDFFAMTIQPGQADDWDDGDWLKVRGAQFEECDHAWTLVDARGDVMACTGLLINNAQCMTAWSVMAANAGPEMTAITRFARSYLSGLPVRRFDIAVRGSFEAGHRWAAVLGFKPEGVQRQWYEDGDDLHVYARINSDAMGVSLEDGDDD